MLLSELADRAGIKYSTALAVVLSFKRTRVSLAIFHDCQEQPVQLKRYGTGFPGLPYQCPRCGDAIGNHQELSYDTLIHLKSDKQC